MFFEKRARITVVKKRVTEHSGLNNTKSKTLYCPHYTVDVTVNGSKRLRTYTVGDSSMFNRLKAGKSYDALLGLTTLKSIKNDRKVNHRRKKQ